MVVGNWNTKTFEKWWLEKLGLNKNNLSTEAMKAGNIHKLFIVAYGLTENDYINYFNEIDKKRIEKIEVKYDKTFIEKEYLPKLQILSTCLKEGVFPANYRKVN